MSVVKVQGNASGTGIFTVLSPNSNTDRTLTLPDQTGTILLGNGSEGTAGQVLTSNGAGALPTFQAAGGSGFAAGTAMLFVQTSAPTGWTKSTTHNDKALRVVSGSASSGGTTAFSTVFANQTPTITTSGLSAAATTLTTTQIPSHTHTIVRATDPCSAGQGAMGTSYVGSSFTSSSTGGGGSHTHSISGSATSSAITLNVQYVDVIIATKD